MAQLAYYSVTNASVKKVLVT